MNRRHNKELCDKYPFLKKYDWLGNFIGYDSTWEDSLPEGWKKVMCPQIWEDLKNILVKANFLDRFRFHKLQQKHGLIYFGYTGIGEGANAKRLLGWDNKYSEMSSYSCVDCGEEVDYWDLDWEEFVCEKCAKERSKQHPDSIFIKKSDLVNYQNASYIEKKKYYIMFNQKGE